MEDTDQLWMDNYGFIYSADGKRLLKGASVEGAYWIPEGVEEIEPDALIGCKIGTLHVPWTAHVHEYDQLIFRVDQGTLIYCYSLNNPLTDAHYSGQLSESSSLIA